MLSYGGKINKICLIPLGLCLFIFFQNCSPSPENLDSQSGTSPSARGPNSSTVAQGNGGTYSGKLILNAPASINPGTSYIVSISGGIAPYQISSPQGRISLLSQSGSMYELFNQFPANVNSFEIIVRDTTGDEVRATIDILATDNIFNFGTATSALIGQDDYIVYSYGMRKIIVFEKNGEAKDMIYPEGDFTKSFDSLLQLQIKRDSLGNIYVLDPSVMKIHKYDSSYNFLTLINLSPLPEIQSSVEIQIRGNEIYVVDKVGNKLHRLSHSGLYKGEYALPALSLQGLSSVAFDDQNDLMYIADDVADMIHVFQNSQLVASYSSLILNDGSTHQLLGPNSLVLGKNGELFFQDSIFKEGPYQGVSNSHRSGEEWTLRLDYSATKDNSGYNLRFRYTGNYSTPTNCLSVFEDVVLTCNNNRFLETFDYNGKNGNLYFPRLGGYNSGVSGVKMIALDEQGNYFVSSDNNRMVGIDKDNNILYRSDLIRGISGIEVVGDRLYVASGYTQSIKVYKKMTFEFLFEFQLRDASGTVFKPSAMSATSRDLFVATRGTGYFRMSFDGEFRERILGYPEPDNSYGNSYYEIIDFDVTEDEVLYVTTNQRRLVRYDLINKKLKLLYQDHRDNWHITVDSNNVVYVNEGNSIVYYDGDTWEELGRFGTSGVLPGTFFLITGLKVDENYIYVCEAGNQRVQRISKSLIK